MQIKVTLVQMDIALGDKEQNLSRARQLTAQVAKSHFILLPELWNTGYALERAKELAEGERGPSTDFMTHLARQTEAYVGGSLLMRRHDHVCNTFVLIAPSGQIVATYDKTHLFKLMNEDKYLSPGKSLVAVPTAWGQVGLAICYDLRFPEIFRQYADVPVDFNLLVAEWPLPRLEHWRTLVRARAIENQCYMLACNRVGHDPSNTFFGHSLVVDPWGEILLEAGDSEGVFTVEIDTASIMTARAKIPVLSDRRRDL